MYSNPTGCSGRIVGSGRHGVTVTEVKGFGRPKGKPVLYRGVEYMVDFLPKVKLEVAVDNYKLDEAVETVSKAVNTGKIGDGKIFIQSLEQVIQSGIGDEGF